MIYITTMQYRKPRQLTWEDVIADKIPINCFTSDSDTTGTITRKYEKLNDDVISKINIKGIIDWLKKFNNDNSKLFEMDRDELFTSWKVAKATGGFRQIDAPLEPLSSELTRLMHFLKDDCGLLYHTSAFAYVTGRCTVDNDRKHANNKSNWYLKTDFSGFFPSTNLDFVMHMFSMIFPMSEVCKDPEGYSELRKALSLNYKKNGEMPQGTTLSPFISNWVMIPIDHKIFNELNKRKLVYTRYADDIIISGVEKFPWQEIVTFIRNALKEFDAPYIIKNEKTRFGSAKGANWNLGLMCNQNYDVTVGYRKKKIFKAAICSFVLDTIHGKYWSTEDVAHLRGLYSYYISIEHDYFKNIIDQQNKKWGVDIEKLFNKYLSNQIA